MKLELESLTERILPSASPLVPPAIAGVTSQMVSTLDQLAHQIGTIESDVSSAWMTLAQELTQAVVANVQQRWDHLLGIDPSAQNQSDSGFSPQETPAISGGHTATPALFSRGNSPTNSIRPSSGSGQSDAWNPVPNGDYLWSDPANWSTDVVPANGLPATFDGSVNNSQCIVDVNTTEGSITLQNGFTAPFEIQSGGALNIPAYTDNNIGADQFNVDFLAADVPVNYCGQVNNVITLGKVNYGAGGKVNVTDGDVLIFGIGANLQQSSGSPINVTNGQLVFGDSNNSGKYSTLQLTNAAANINIVGTSSMIVYQTGTTLIDNSANPGAVISNTIGTVTLQRVAGAGFTTINVPLQNHSTLNINGGVWDFDLKDAKGNDLSMDSGTIKMNNNAQVHCNDNYTQTGGVFNIMDAQETFFTGAFSAANFNGGTVTFTNPSGYGSLNIDTTVFNGATLDMRIQANSSNSDLILMLGGNTCTIKGNSTINVTLNGSQTQSSGWVLIETPNTITGDFQTVNLPAGVFEEPVSKVWACSYSD